MTAQVLPYRYFGWFRLLLALMVMFQHFAANAAPLPFAQAMQPYEFGSLAVLVFFCLSGFVIAEAADLTYRGKPGAFISNRSLRIVPHYVVALLLSIALQRYYAGMGTLHVERDAPLPPASIFSLRSIGLNMISILPYPDRWVDYKFIPIAWAVRIEVIFYLVVGLCLWLQRPFSRRFTDGFAASCVALLLAFTLLFVLSVAHVTAPMFGFVPYFAYGAGLYFALTGGRTGRWVMLGSLAAISWHFLSLPPVHPTLGFQRDVLAQMVLLGLLIGSMSWLAVSRFQHGKKYDSAAGKITYPLYLYHYVVLIVVTAGVIDYSYAMLIGGMAASLIFSWAMARVIDPLIDRRRDKIRGQKLE